MKIKSLIIGGAITLSSIGAFVLNGDCTGYDHKVPINDKVTWCLTEDDYSQATDFIEKRISISTSYNPDYAIALFRYDVEFRDRIQAVLIGKWEKYEELDEDDVALNDYLSGKEHTIGDYGEEVKMEHVNDLMPK